MISPLMIAVALRIWGSDLPNGVIVVGRLRFAVLGTSVVSATVWATEKDGANIVAASAAKTAPFEKPITLSVPFLLREKTMRRMRHIR